MKKKNMFGKSMVAAPETAVLAESFMIKFD